MAAADANAPAIGSAVIEPNPFNSLPSPLI